MKEQYYSHEQKDELNKIRDEYYELKKKERLNKEFELLLFEYY